MTTLPEWDLKKAARMFIDDELSAAEVGKYFGLNRNTVLGRLGRAGVKKTEAQSTRTTKRERRQRESVPPAPSTVKRGEAAAAARRAALLAEAQRAPPPKGGKDLLALSAGDCKYPLPGPTGERQRFCAAGAMPGQPYCQRCARKAYTEGTSPAELARSVRWAASQ